MNQKGEIIQVQTIGKFKDEELQEEAKEAQTECSVDIQVNKKFTHIKLKSQDG